MFTAIAMLIALVRPPPGPMPEVCELPNVLPGRTPSRSCMGCHDGTIGAVADVTFKTRLEGFHGEAEELVGGSHPVDIDYEEAAQRRPGWLTPAAALPPEVMLGDGLVTCLSCHHPDSKEPFRTSLPMSASGLCFACHQT